MKNAIDKLGRASLTAALALGLVTAGCARQPRQGNSTNSSLSDNGGIPSGASGDSAMRTDPTLGSGTPYPGTGVGGTGMGTDTSYHRDTSWNRRGDSLFRSGPTGSPSGGTGNPNSQGMGGSGGIPGVDTMRITPKDSSHPSDTIGAPEWNERG